MNKLTATLFGGAGRRSAAELVHAAEVADPAEAPEYPVSASSRRLPELKAWMRELNPWFAGAVGHADRVGALSQQARTLRMLCIALALTAIALSVGLVRMAVELAHTRVVPYVVQVDKHGFVVPIGAAERDALQSPRQVMAAIGRWLSSYRVVTGERRLQEGLVQQAFFFVAPKSVAAQKMNEWYAKHPAFDGTGRRVHVEIARIAPMQVGSDFVVDWSEETSDAQGERSVKNLYTAVVSVQLSPTEELDHVLVNPSGVFLRDFSITKLQ